MKGWQAGMVGLAVVAMTGCAMNFAKRSPWDIQQLAELSDQLEQFKTLAKLKAEEADQLRKAKEELESRLSSSEATIGYDERGLVARMMDTVLFDSGKATLRRSANSVLDRVAEAIAAVPSQPVGVEGHTDNVPIQKSGWADKYRALAGPRERGDRLPHQSGDRPQPSDGCGAWREPPHRVE